MTSRKQPSADHPASDEPRRDLQPALHELVSSVAAPALLLSPADGQLTGAGVTGWFVEDLRCLDVLRVEVAGSDLDLVRASATGAGSTQLDYAARSLGDPILDPTVVVERRRDLAPDELVEHLTVRSFASRRVTVTLTAVLGSDLGSLAQVRQGRRGDSLPARADGTGLVWERGADRVRVGAEPTPQEVDPAAGRLTWVLDVEPGRSTTVTLRGALTRGTAGTFAAGGAAPWTRPDVTADDIRVRRVAEQSLADLEGLLMRDGDDAFLAAGSPWYLTLFGRDSLWAARMMLPFGTDLALATLRTLARRQGSRDVPETEEQPGKILHEVRGGELDLGEMKLPPLYYGTVDATPLFVVLLAEAHRWGADPAEVEALLPAARGCLEWLVAQSEETGWLRYVDRAGTGLANQGWKDSHDAVRHADGTLAEAPIALSEVQGYAYQAAVEGGALLEAFGQRPPEGLAAWAEDLRARFAGAFWAEDRAGRFPAIALDGGGRRAESVASNMGHLLGTGLVAQADTAAIAARLSAPGLDSGFGLRTLDQTSPGFSRLSYHCGTVWPHDTAIAVAGLAREGFLAEAASLTGGLIAASEAFGYRLPELYGGDSAADVPLPSAYPSACRPQAWSAAAPLAALVATTGVRVDAPARTISHPARVVTGWGAFALHGLRLGTETLSVAVDQAGRVTISAPEGYAVVTS